MAKKYHPDVNKEKGANEKFQELSEAYEVVLKYLFYLRSVQVLSDSKRRSDYDNFGSTNGARAGTGSSPGQKGFDSGWEYRSGRSAEQMYQNILLLS